MRVSGEDLFADPLNVREKRPAAYDAGGIAEPGLLRPSRGATDPGRVQRPQGYHPDLEEVLNA